MIIDINHHHSNNTSIEQVKKLNNNPYIDNIISYPYNTPVEIDSSTTVYNKLSNQDLFKDNNNIQIFDPIRSSSPSILMNNNFKTIPPPPQLFVNNHNKANIIIHSGDIDYEDDLLSNNISPLSSSPITNHKNTTTSTTTVTNNTPDQLLLLSPLSSSSLVNSTSSTQLLSSNDRNQHEILIDIYSDSLSSEAAADNTLNIFNSKWIASIAYLTWLGAVFVLIKEKRSVFIQFHSLQSYIIGISFMGLQFLFVWSKIMMIILWCTYLLFILFMIYKVLRNANNQITYKLPVIGNYCENFAIKRSLEYSILLKRVERQIQQNLLKQQQQQQQTKLKTQQNPIKTPLKPL